MNCQEPGCTGKIEDGHCTECGLAPRAGDAARTAPTANRRPTSGTANRRPTSSTTKLSRPRLGAGLVEIAPLPEHDPRAAIRVDPHIAAARRGCANPDCGRPVGRSRDGQPGRTEGFCPGCGWEFSFRPQLTAGQLVYGQYAVEGCIAHGGLGWIYLARDRNVHDKWVVLKGLLNTTDPDALAAALAERRFLAEIDHPRIVRIINVVQHGRDGYIVMEYVPGGSLRALLDAHGPLPVERAIAYMLEILPAFAYLHELRLLYCDFKPDNVMQTGNSVKLIDLGGAYRIDEPAGSVYGTRGYQAPEIAARGPSVASDLYTIGRTLAVLCTAGTGYQQRYEHTLPSPDDEPVFRRHDALYRFLQRATAAEADDRFQSAEEMAAQLLGVLREVVATGSGRTINASSELFTPELRVVADGPDWRGLPSLLVSSDDPAAGFLASLPTTVATSDDDLIALLASAPEQSVEVRLRHARVLVDGGRDEDAELLLDELAADDPWEWRVNWYRGLLALQRGTALEALRQFDAVYRTVPGELAPKLALGYALELAGEFDRAGHWYDIVSRTDPSSTLAAFGLARCCLALNDRPGSLDAFDRIPETSNAYHPAQFAKAAAMLDGDAPPTYKDASAAAAVIDGLPEGEARTRLTVSLFERALAAVVREPDPTVREPLLEHEFTESSIRLGLEAAYRDLARLASSARDRIVLVDRANQARPRTLT